ncbi:MAG: hypothetical protein J7K21_05880 [Desulfurococcales archaeon]|nr:hypothetical protein [Desulfurococcales archaeon]
MNGLDDLIDYFVVEVSYGRSVDWYLVKLSSIASSIEDLCRGTNIDPRDLFRDFLEDNKVRKALEKLSCYSGDAIESIKNDPRFKNLRRYIDLIEQTLARIPCVEKELEVIPRPATWSIEYMEKKAEEKHVLHKPKAYISKDLGSWIEKNIDYLVLALLVLSIIILIYSLISR